MVLPLFLNVLLILRCWANREVHIAGKAVTRLLSRGFPDCLRITAPSDPIRACTIIFFLQKLYSKPVNKPHTRVRCKQAGYLSIWLLMTNMHFFSQSVDKNLFISAKSGSKMSDFQSVPKASSKLIFTLERTCVKNIMFREGRQKRGLLFWFRAYEVQSFAPARQRQTKQILELRNPKYAINI